MNNHPQPAINRRTSHERVKHLLEYMDKHNVTHGVACKHFGYRVDSMSRAITKYRKWKEEGK